MAKKPYELQLYQIRYSATDRKAFINTNIAVKGSSQGTVDEVEELADALLQIINANSDATYQLMFMECTGSVTIWKNE